MAPDKPDDYWRSHFAPGLADIIVYDEEARRVWRRVADARFADFLEEHPGKALVMVMDADEGLELYGVADDVIALESMNRMAASQHGKTGSRRPVFLFAPWPNAGARCDYYVQLEFLFSRER